MRVLHLLTNFHPVLGGLETFVLGLARRSRERGIDARVLCLNRASRHEPKLAPRTVVQGVPVQRIEFVDLVYYKPAPLPLDELRRADVLHVHGIGANLDYVALSRRWHRRPFVVSTHGGIFHTSALASLKRRYLTHIARRSLAAADRVIAVSRQDIELLRPIAPAIELIENAVDFPTINSLTPSRVPGRCLFVGRFAANKRLDLLLHAFARAVDAAHNLSLRLVGPDWQQLKPGLVRLANELGISDRVVFVGAVDGKQLADEYAAAGLLLSASAHEGFGITVVEAMSAGVVPVVNDIAAFRDLITDNVDGLLVDFSDSSTTADLIRRASSRDLAMMRDAAIRRAQDFSWERQLPKWISLYSALHFRHADD